VRTIKLILGARDAASGGYDLRLEEVDTDDRRTTTDTLPAAHVDGTRPLDDHGAALDPQAIRSLVLRDKPPPSGGELERIGAYLHGVLAYGKVGSRWDDLRNAYPGEQPPNEGLRVLLDIEDEELRPLPWELARRGNRWMFVDPRNVVARISSEYVDDGDMADDWWPLRIVVVVGAEAADPMVKVDDEIERLQEALAKVLPDVDPEFIIRPAEDSLPKRLEDLNPHVLHFIGHGESSAKGGALVMHDDATGSRWDWLAKDIPNQLSITPRIVVLNACRTGQLGAQDGTWEVADAFAELGVPAVVAMQGDIEGRAAVAFAAAFFEGLLAGELLDVAVTRGRRRAADTVGFAARDFSLPTLTLREPAERIVPKRYAIDAQKLFAVEAVLPVAAFVDRTKERRRMLAHLAPAEERADALLTAVDGDSQVGKTTLVHWALRQLAYRGHDVAYVDMRTPDETPRTQVGVLRAIRDAVQRVRPAPPGDIRSFDRWTRDLNHLVEGEPPPPDPVTEAVKDLNHEYNADPSDLEQIFEGFLEVLGAVVKDGPMLLIALDHLEAVNPSDLKADLTPSLIQPIVAGRYPRLRLLLAGLGVQAAFETTVKPGLEVTVPSFPPEDMWVLVTQYLVYHDCWSDERKTLVNALRNSTQPWKPEQLGYMLKVARMLR
jgi:hypothetical protein